MKNSVISSLQERTPLMLRAISNIDLVVILQRYLLAAMLCWIVLVSLAALPHCNSLSSSTPSKVSHQTNNVVISQRSNGQQEIFSFDSLEDKSSVIGLKSESSTIQEQINTLKAVTHHIGYALQSTFLPSVITDDINKNLSILSHTGYLKYILYDNIQDLSTSLKSVLAKQRILEAVGVGRQDATALSATLSFIGRDFCGIISSLLFTSLAATR